MGYCSGTRCCCTCWSTCLFLSGFSLCLALFIVSISKQAIDSKVTKILPEDSEDFETVHMCEFDNANLLFLTGAGTSGLTTLIFGLMIFFTVFFLVWTVLSYIPDLTVLTGIFERLDYNPPALKFVDTVPFSLQGKKSSLGGIIFVLAIALFLLSAFYDIGYTYSVRYERSEISLLDKLQPLDYEMHFWMLLDSCDGVNASCVESSDSRWTTTLEKEFNSVAQVVISVPLEGLVISTGSSKVLKYGVAVPIATFESGDTMLCSNPNQTYSTSDLISLNDNFYFNNFESSFYCTNFDENSDIGIHSLQLDLFPMLFCRKPTSLSACPPATFTYGTFEVFRSLSFTPTTIDPHIIINPSVTEPQRPICYIDETRQSAISLIIHTLRGIGSFIGLYALIRNLSLVAKRISIAIEKKIMGKDE